MKIKNSNKILILILVLTVAIPLLVAQIYLHKIKTGDFEYEKPTVRIEHPELDIKGSLSGVKAIKLIGGNYTDLLSATIIHGDLANYEITRNRAADSVEITHIADTLVFKYINANNARIRYVEDHFTKIRLNLPDNLPIYANNCHLRYPSLDKPLQISKLSPAEFFLDHGAILALGTQTLVFHSVPDTVIAGNKGKDVYLRDTTQATEDSLNNIYGKIGAVKIHVNHSTVDLEQPLIFDSLQLTMINNATFKLTHPIKIKSLRANIDPKTNIEGDFKSVSSINELLK